MTVHSQPTILFYCSTSLDENSLPVDQEGVKRHIMLKLCQRITPYGRYTTLNTLNIMFVKDMNSFYDDDLKVV